MAEYTAESRAEVHRLFRASGYRGELLVIDDSGDECIFVVPVGSIRPFEQDGLARTLQPLLRRKVWIVDATEPWIAQARPFK